MTEATECSRCYSALDWEGDIPEDEEDIVCHSCLWDVVYELRAENARLKAELKQARASIAELILEHP